MDNWDRAHLLDQAQRLDKELWLAIQALTYDDRREAQARRGLAEAIMLEMSLSRKTRRFLALDIVFNTQPIMPGTEEEHLRLLKKIYPLRRHIEETMLKYPDFDFLIHG